MIHETFGCGLMVSVLGWMQGDLLSVVAFGITLSPTRELAAENTRLGIYGGAACVATNENHNPLRRVPM